MMANCIHLMINRVLHLVIFINHLLNITNDIFATLKKLTTYLNHVTSN